MYKIAVMGSSDTVMGFKALGLDTYPVNTPEEASASLKTILHAETPYAIVYVEESIAENLAPVINKYRSNPETAFILIPGREGSTGLGLRALKDAVEKAVGSDITGD